MRVFLKFLKPYKRLCFFTVLVLTVDVIGALLIPKLTGKMIDVGVGNRDYGLIVRTGLLMLGVALAAGVGTLVGSFLCARLSAKLGRDIRNALYDKILQFSAQDMEKFGTGSLITRALNDTNIVQQAFVFSVQMILPVPIICVAGIVMAFLSDWTMGLLLLGASVVLVICAFFVTKKAALIFRKLQEHLDRINVEVRENITGVRVVRAFHKEEYEEERMNRTFTHYANTGIKANRLFAGLECLAFLVINICIVLILWLGGNRIAVGATATGQIEIGKLTEQIGYATLILWYLIMAQMVIILLPRARTCLGRINAVLTHVPQIADDGREVTETEISEEICRFEKTGFRFADAEEATLENLNFVCRRGETTAIIGSTGSGKSTIAKLLLRFHEITDGVLSFEGCDIRNIPQHILREKVAYVPQKAWLFSGTIESNLRYGNENATKEDMERALKIAQADFVERLPDGLQSRVAQGGTNFSGGQKQRLSIARALVKKADLYIFDDSFSALDFKTDAALRHALASEIKDAAVLIIAQRVNTILHADNIIVLEEGRIVGMGRHDSLIKDCPVYASIAKSQMKGGA